MNTREVASHLVALNNNEGEQPSASGVFEGPRSRSKRPKTGTNGGHSQEDTELTLSVAYGDNLVDRDEDDDEEDEVPGTPPNERRIETCIHNWS